MEKVTVTFKDCQTEKEIVVSLEVDIEKDMVNTSVEFGEEGAEAFDGTATMGLFNAFAEVLMGEASEADNQSIH